MKLWRAKFIDSRGNKIEEDFYLPTLSDVRRLIRRQHGGWVLDIREHRRSLIEWSDVRSSSWQLQLLRALRSQSRVGSAGTALVSIIENETDPRKRMALLPAITVLKAGGSFHDALRQIGLFAAPTLALLLAGERSGDLRGAIKQAMETIEEDIKQKRAALAMLAWLVFDIVNVVGTSIGTHFYYIPYLRSTSNSGDPEAVAKLMEAINQAEAINLSVLILSAFAVVVGLVIAYNFYKHREQPDHLGIRLLRLVPSARVFMLHRSLTDTVRTMARLLHGYVPVDESLKIVATVSLDGEVRQYWSRVLERIYQGMPSQKAFALKPLNRLEQDQIVTFQTTGELAERLENIAEERAISTGNARRKLVMTGIIALMSVFGVVIFISIWLVYLQNESLFNSLNEMRGG